VLTWVLEALPYAGLIVVLGAALVGVVKDWRTDKWWVRWPLLLFALLGASVSLVSVYVANSEAVKQSQELKEDNRVLRVEVTTTREVLSGQNSQLLDRVIELEGKVTSEELQREVRSLREELAQASAPKPRARFVFGIVDDASGQVDPDKPKTSDSVPVALGVASVTLSGVNASTVFASQVMIWFRICKGCEFAEENSGLLQPAENEQERLWKVGAGPDGTYLPAIELFIRPPKKATGMKLDVRVRCLECEPTRTQTFALRLLRVPP